MTVTETGHDIQTPNRRVSTQCNNEMETISDCTLSSNTTNTCRQMDIAVDNKVNGELADSPKKGDGKTDTWQINTVKQMFKCNMGE